MIYDGQPDQVRASLPDADWLRIMAASFDNVPRHNRGNGQYIMISDATANQIATRLHFIAQKMQQRLA